MIIMFFLNGRYYKSRYKKLRIQMEIQPVRMNRKLYAVFFESSPFGRTLKKLI
jgi:hypothetical protein